MKTSNKLFGLIGALALSSLATGCTMGVVVDDNFQPVPSAYNTTTGLGMNGASITWFALDGNNRPTGTTYNFNFNGQPWMSFDPYADNGASNGITNLSNVKQYIPEGNYYVSYFQPQMGFARSANFHHSYDQAACQDPFTKQTIQDCEQYYLQLDTNPYCSACHGPLCSGGTQPLPTHNGMKIIKMCVPSF